jgi:hypothetical protein
VAYNEMGQFAIIELDGVRHRELIKLLGPYQLKNATCEKKMPISVVRFYKKTLSFAIGCLDGFVYMYSSALMDLRKMAQISQKSVVGLEI